MKYTIYMLKDEHRNKLFLSYTQATEHGGVNLDEYEPVYTGEILSADTTIESLERIFTRINHIPPDDYNCRSLSVSDIICIKGKSYWYCDSIGFKEIAYEPKRVWLVMSGGYFGTISVQSIWSSEEKASVEVERLKSDYSDRPLRLAIKEMEVK